MKIGIDLYSYDKPGENNGVGPGVYAWNLLKEIVLKSPEDKFYIFANRKNVGFIPKKENVIIIVNSLPTKLRLLRIVHEQILIPFWFIYYNINFVHFFGNNISYLLYKKSILTVFDLMWKFYIDSGSKSLKYKYFALTVPISLRLAKAVITISGFVAKEIHDKKLRLKPSFPILLAPGELKFEDDNSISKKIKELSTSEFIYTVTTSMPHKNLMTLLIAYKNLINHKSFHKKLVITGQLKGNFIFDIIKYINENQLKDKVILTGFISESEKQNLYKNANMFVYPSFYEGFGLPILEAMFFEVPVIASNSASMPEVGGDACLYFNPTSVLELEEKILLLSTKPELRNALITKGINQHKKFTWSKTACETKEVYNKVFS